MKGKINSESTFGIITSLIALIFIKISMSFKAGTSDGVPGPGYFPIIVACVVLVLSIILIAQGIIKHNVYFKIEDGEKQGLKQMLIILVLMAAFLVVWNFVPFVIAGILFVLAMCHVLKQTLKYSIVYSVAVIGVLYVVFNIAFRVNLNIT